MKPLLQKRFALKEVRYLFYSCPCVLEKSELFMFQLAMKFIKHIMSHLESLLQEEMKKNILVFRSCCQVAAIEEYESLL